MSWYWWKKWRVAASPSREGVMYDSDGRWRHIIGPFWWLTERVVAGGPHAGPPAIYENDEEP